MSFLDDSIYIVLGQAETDIDKAIDNLGWVMIHNSNESIIPVINALRGARIKVKDLQRKYVPEERNND